MTYKTISWTVILSFLLMGLYQFCITNRAIVNVTLETNVRTLFKIYYKSENGHFSERKKAAVVISPKKKEYSFRLADLNKISELRIDTSEKPSTVVIKSLRMNQEGVAPLILSTKKDFEKLLPEKDEIKLFDVTDSGVTVVADGNDPKMFFPVGSLAKTPHLKGTLLRLALIVVFSFFIVQLVQNTLPDFGYIPVMGLIALVLIYVMAAISLYNQHPDESVHVSAGKYYMENNLPPKIGARDILHTYSDYGVSRLHSGEIAYFFAGKFAQLLAPLHLPDYLALRYFNVALFAALLFASYTIVPFRLIFLPALLSPQIWYIFSYFNSEAFALTLTFTAAYQLVVEDSWWNRLMTGRAGAWSIPLIIGLGGCLGLLMLTKKNFYFFILFICFYLLWRILFRKTERTFKVISRMAAIGLIGITLFGAVRGVDAWINDFSRGEKIMEAREKYAKPLFNPKTPLEKRIFSLQMKDRGMDFKAMFHKGRWGEKCFRTSFGEYGYLTVAGSPNYYYFMNHLLIIFGLWAAGSIVLRGGLEGITLLGITFCSAIGLMAAAFYHSWTVDFQAQGRYFLPILGMLSMLIYHQRKSLGNVVCVSLTGMVYCSALYSFLFVALWGIRKVTALS